LNHEGGEVCIDTDDKKKKKTGKKKERRANQPREEERKLESILVMRGDNMSCTRYRRCCQREKRVFNLSIHSGGKKEGSSKRQKEGNQVAIAINLKRT